MLDEDVRFNGQRLTWSYRFGIVLIIALCGTVAHAAGSVKLENALSACVSIRQEPPIAVNGQLMLPVALDVKQIIAECGCKSAIASYTSLVQRDGYRSFLQGGSLGLKESGKHTLTLASDVSLVGDRDMVLTLGCAQPD